MLFLTEQSWAMYCQELQSPALPLLVRTPNGVQQMGQGRERWLLNPGAATATQMQMFEFLGKLMGVAVRTKNYLNLNLR